MNNLKILREQAGLSQSQLANASDVSVRMIQGYEQEYKDITKAQAITIKKLSKALGCTMEDLIVKDDEKLKTSCINYRVFLEETEDFLSELIYVIGKYIDYENTEVDFEEYEEYGVRSMEDLIGYAVLSTTSAYDAFIVNSRDSLKYIVKDLSEVYDFYDFDYADIHIIDTINFSKNIMAYLDNCGVAINAVWKFGKNKEHRMSFASDIPRVLNNYNAAIIVIHGAKIKKDYYK